MEKREIYLVQDPNHGPEWRIRRINGIEQDKWQEGPGYPGLEAFWQEETLKEGWQGGAVDQGENDLFVTFWR